MLHATTFTQDVKGRICTQVKHGGDKRNLISGSNISGGGFDRSMDVFNKEMTRCSARVDGGRSNL